MNYEHYYNRFLKEWGIEAQSRMAIEEMSELTKEICKLERHKNDPEKKKETTQHLIEEIADVLIVTEQLALYYGKEEVEKVKQFKCNRAAKYLKPEGDQHE